MARSILATALSDIGYSKLNTQLPNAAIALLSTRAVPDCRVAFAEGVHFDGLLDG